MFWTKSDIVKILVLAALVAVTALVLFPPPPAAPATGTLHCQLGPFERCALRAVNLTLVRGGYSARATKARCALRGVAGVCEMTFNRGDFCATIRISQYDAGHWIASLGRPHDCKRGPPA